METTENVNLVFMAVGCVLLSGYTIDIDEIREKGEKISFVLFHVYDKGKDMGEPVSLLLQEPVKKRRGGNYPGFL